MKKTSRIKSMVSMLSALILIFSMLSVNVSALEIPKNEEVLLTYPDLHDSKIAVTEALEKHVDTDEFKNYLFEQFSNFSTSIDISKFEIPNTDENIESIKNLIWHNMPEAFQVYGLGTIPKNNYISQVLVSYYDWCSADKYPSMYFELQNTASELLQGIENNESLNDVEKALLVHDRLAVWNEYDYENYLNNNIPNESYTAYGALVKRTSVCDGYTKAYIYLLNRVGIKSIYCSSQELNHSWNIVYINGIPYHTDVTFDDKVWDVTGRVYHENLLVSSNLFYEQNHAATDYDTTPQDSSYDNYYWRDSNTEFQLIDNTLYFINNSNSTLNKISNEVITQLKSVSDKWLASESSFWSGNFSKLSSDGNKLYYSLSDAIYEFDVSDNTSEAIYYPDLSVGNYFSIFGFTYEDGYLICELNNSPNFTKDTKKLYQVRQLYDSQAPKVTLTSVSVLSTPDKTTYYVGDSLNTSGLSLKLTYSDGSTKAVTSGYITSGFSSASAGTKTVTVSYGGKSTTFKVSVIKRSVSAPSAPVLSKKTSTTVTLTKVTGYEYSKDGKTWQSSNIFKSLNADTTYSFYQRKAETDTSYASQKSSVLGVKTNPKETLIKENNVWYYTVNDIKVSATTLCKYNGTWYYVKSGKLSKDNTLVKYNNVWYHVNAGKLANDTTLVKYNNVWYYVKNGKLSKDNTLVKYNNVWYHVNAGKLANDTTLVKYNNTWYYVKSGKLNTSNTLVKYNGVWYHVKGGKKVNDTTLCKYGSKWYYVQNGKVNFKANLKYKYNGKWYTVRNGVVV